VSKSRKFYANESAQLVLNCEVNGRPKPNIKWFKNDELLGLNQSANNLNMNKYNYVIENGSLVIYNLNPIDSGEYFCIASSLENFPVAVVNYTVNGSTFYQLYFRMFQFFINRFCFVLLFQFSNRQMSKRTRSTYSNRNKSSSSVDCQTMKRSSRSKQTGL